MERDLCFIFMTPDSSDKLNDMNNIKIVHSGQESKGKI